MMPWDNLIINQLSSEDVMNLHSMVTKNEKPKPLMRTGKYYYANTNDETCFSQNKINIELNKE